MFNRSVSVLYNRDQALSAVGITAFFSGEGKIKGTIYEDRINK